MIKIQIICFETAPISQARRAHGRVYGHPSFKDGENVTTGEIISESPGKFRTQNSEYQIISS